MDLMKRDESFEAQITAPSDWNSYLWAAVKFILIFSLLTFFMEEYVFFAHQGQAWTLADYILGILYLAIILLTLIQMTRKLPMAAIMLAAPTLPLFMLLIVVLTLPVLHLLHKQKSCFFFGQHCGKLEVVKDGSR